MDGYFGISSVFEITRYYYGMNETGVGAQVFRPILLIVTPNIPSIRIGERRKAEKTINLHGFQS